MLSRSRRRGRRPGSRHVAAGSAGEFFDKGGTVFAREYAAQFLLMACVLGEARERDAGFILHVPDGGILPGQPENEIDADIADRLHHQRFGTLRCDGGVVFDLLVFVFADPVIEGDRDYAVGADFLSVTSEGEGRVGSRGLNSDDYRGREAAGADWFAFTMASAPAYRSSAVRSDHSEAFCGQVMPCTPIRCRMWTSLARVSVSSAPVSLNGVWTMGKMPSKGVVAAAARERKEYRCACRGCGGEEIASGLRRHAVYPRRVSYTN